MLIRIRDFSSCSWTVRDPCGTGAWEYRLQGPEEVTDILDLLHASGYLSEAATCSIPKGVAPQAQRCVVKDRTKRTGMRCISAGNLPGGLITFRIRRESHHIYPGCAANAPD